ATGWWIMKLRLQDLEFRQKSGLAYLGSGEGAAHGNDLSARIAAMNQPTNESINETTNQPTNGIFSSMFVKARCARRKGRELKQLRQFPVSVCERKVTKRLSRSRYALARAGENAKAPESRCDSGAVSIWLVFELGAQATGWNTSLHPVACASGSHLR